MRVDGKFMIGKDIPDGQAAVVGLLEDCFELAHELKNQADEEDEKVADTQSEEQPPAAQVPLTA